MRPPPAGRADLDVDANYTALTPRPRLSSPSGAHPIAFTEHHSTPVCRSLLQYLTRCLVTAGMGLPLYSPFSRGFSLT